ncbi:MAG TPA: acireductone dioxygenase, partial [Calditerricola sp.]
MAIIRVRKTGERITGIENVRAFLDRQGVLYERWD